MLWPIELTIRGAPGRNRTGTTFGHRVLNAARLPISPQAQVVWWAGEVRSRRTTEDCSSGAPGRSRTDTSRGHCFLRAARIPVPPRARTINRDNLVRATGLEPAIRRTPIITRREHRLGNALP